MTDINNRILDRRESNWNIQGNIIMKLIFTFKDFSINSEVFCGNITPRAQSNRNVDGNIIWAINVSE